MAIHGLARALRDGGHEVTLLHAARSEHRVSLDGIRMVYIGTTRKSIYPLLIALRRLDRYHVIHANDESGAWFGLRSRLKRLPLVVQFQPPRVKPEGFLRSGWRWRYIGVAARNAPILVCPSDWLGRELARRYHLPDDRVRVVPYGVADHWFEVGSRDPVDRPPGPRVVLVNMKGVDVALRAFAAAVPSGEARLELFGTEKRAGETMELAGRLGIGERVVVHGFVPNEQLPARLLGADLLLHPTRSESFGQVLAEAAALGIPVISSRVNAVPEVVADGETGLLCPSGDVDAYAAALASLLSNGDLRRRMGKANRARADSRWRWERVVARLHSEAYAPLLETAQRSAADLNSS